MYTRSPQGRFPRDLRVPKNYAGNAFSATLHEKESQNPLFIDENISEYIPDEQEISKSETQAPLRAEENTDEKSEENSEKSEAKETGLFSFPKFDIGLGKLFSRGGINIGFEEILILGLILLIANERKGDDLILLLILLLFIQ